MNTEDREMDHEPYFIEVDKGGCSECGHGRFWRVVCPDDSMINATYENEEDAAKMAEMLNEAYAAGRASMQERRP
jgi:hypothetical protein